MKKKSYRSKAKDRIFYSSLVSNTHQAQQPIYQKPNDYEVAQLSFTLIALFLPGIMMVMIIIKLAWFPYTSGSATYTPKTKQL